MSEMTKYEIDLFLAEPILARIATVRPDGRPHVVPVWYWWDGTSIYIDTPPSFVKAKNLMHNPNCAIAVDVTEGGLRFKAVILEGQVELIREKRFAFDIIDRIYTKYLGEEGVKSATPQRMIHESDHVIIKMTPNRVLTWNDTRKALAPIP
jgi:PPOX class probable F420-dependent enzyme